MPIATIGNTIDAFLSALNVLDGKFRLPPDLLRNCLNEEEALRRLFATSPTDPLLADPHVGLVDIFSTLESYREFDRTFFNLLRTRTHQDFVNPTFVPRESRLFVNDAPHVGKALVSDIATFKKNWDAFTYGILDNLNWSGIIAAGGAVQACMLPFIDPELGKNPFTSAHELDTHYQKHYPTSDVDLFLIGSPMEFEAEMLVHQITKSIRQTVRFDIVYVRKANTISIHTLFPYRPLQIILRSYRSPAEVLAGFDVDAGCYAFDGETVWTNPRGIAAFIRRGNTIDITRRSPSYESRLAKYARRGFEVLLPSLQRTRIDLVAVYNRDLRSFPNGLARLLVLEKMTEDPEYYKFSPPNHFRFGQPKDDRSILLRRQPLEQHQLDASDYDLVWTGVPYGKGWDAKTIGNLIKKVDAKMNEPERLARDGRSLHRHAVVASEDLDVLLYGTFCQHCPCPSSFYDVSAEMVTSKYIFGRIEFISANAGRQLRSGSFNPIDIDDWTDDAYLPQAQAERQSSVENA